MGDQPFLAILMRSLGPYSQEDDAKQIQHPEQGKLCTLFRGQIPTPDPWQR